MRLFRYDDQGTVRDGIVLDGVHCALPCSLEQILADERPAAEQEKAFRAMSLPALDAAALRFAPCCVDRPEKILCVGLNYMAHQQETDMRNSAKFPPLFCKFRNSLLGHEGTIPLPRCAERFDYEVELVITIGHTVREADEREAAAAIFGYTVGNDFSARDLQTATSQWLMGKACDGFAPIGPYLVTADALDPADLAITSRVNGELRQNGRTSDMIFSCAQIVSHISQVMTLVPGDVIYTGTPAGVILGMPEEKRVWLKAGDTVEVEVEGIGTLRSTLA